MVFLLTFWSLMPLHSRLWTWRSVRTGIRPLRGARPSIETSCNAGPVDWYSLLLLSLSSPLLLLACLCCQLWDVSQWSDWTETHKPNHDKRKPLLTECLGPMITSISRLSRICSPSLVLCWNDFPLVMQIAEQSLNFWKQHRSDILISSIRRHPSL